MKVLFIGGSGNISSACTAEALEQGHEVFHFNRGLSPNHEFKNSVHTIVGDVHNPDDREKIRALAPFDVVANFIAFVPEHIRNDIASLSDICAQYIFISSATVYQKPPDNYIITEETPLSNPFWEYARNKIACENLLQGQQKIKYTIVRPSYTYGKKWIPVALTAQSYSPVFRMKNELPIISHGDGESLWITTHASDFASAFVGLFGNPVAMNNHFHITSDEVHSWNAIYRLIGKIVEVEPRPVQIPSNFIHKYAPDWGDGLLGDKALSAVFDNSKIKAAVPGWMAKKSLEDGLRESIAWFEEKPERMKLNSEEESLMNLIIEKFAVL